MTDTRLWAPRITVAAIVERAGKYLLIEEHSEHGAVLNQPAGHLDPGESLTMAAARETLDKGILRAVWLTPDEIRRSVSRHRSPLVMSCIEDHAAGKRYPLELLAYFNA